MYEPSVKVKVLRKGDKVLNVLIEEHGARIIIQRKSGEAHIVTIELDEKGLPRLVPEKGWSITYGEGEIESSVDLKSGAKNSSSEPIKVTTF